MEWDPSLPLSEDTSSHTSVLQVRAPRFLFCSPRGQINRPRLGCRGGARGSWNPKYKIHKHLGRPGNTNS